MKRFSYCSTCCSFIPRMNSCISSHHHTHTHALTHTHTHTHIHTHTHTPTHTHTQTHTHTVLLANVLQAVMRVVYVAARRPSTCPATQSSLSSLLCWHLVQAPMVASANWTLKKMLLHLNQVRLFVWEAYINSLAL